MVAITSRNIISRFQSTGIFSNNRNLFTDINFAPSNVTDRSLESESFASAFPAVITAENPAFASSEMPTSNSNCNQLIEVQTENINETRCLTPSSSSEQIALAQ